MKRGITSALVALPAFLLLASTAAGEDWPQWMGPNRNGRVSGFTVPKAWPKELTKKWQVKVGDGVATPALVGDKLYVFSRDGNSEVTRCLNVADGKEIWADKYDAEFISKGGDNGYQGPRSSVAVGDGMVVTLGVNGTVSGLNAADGKKVWRHEKTTGYPKFHTSSSPLIVDKLAVVQVGDDFTGSVAAYDLATGKERWTWGGEGTGYASPTLMTVDGTKTVVAETMQNVVGLSLDGKLLWKTPFPLPPAGGKSGFNYNSSTPVVSGSTVVFAGTNRGTRAIKVEKTSSGFAAKELWSNKDYSVNYNSPIVRDKLVYGLTSGRNVLYAVSADTGAKAWDHEFPVTGGKGGKGGGFGGGAGYGSIVDAGPAMFLLTPSGKLVVFEPGDKEYKELASYNVGSRTYAYPIVSGNRIVIKDADSVALYTVE